MAERTTMVSKRKQPCNMGSTDPQSADAVIDRMRQALGPKSDADLARALGVPPSTVATWRHRNSVPYEHCVAIAANRGVNLNWLLLGQNEDDRYSKLNIELDLQLMMYVIRGVIKNVVIKNDVDIASAFDERAYQLGADYTVDRLVNDIARLICSLYLQRARMLKEVLLTGRFSREEALALLAKVAPEERLGEEAPPVLGPGEADGTDGPL